VSASALIAGMRPLHAAAFSARVSESTAMKRHRRVIEFLKEFWRFLRVRKKFWLRPIVVIMGSLGGIFVLTKGSVIAPFFYVLF
jgi:hypothetical protein